jgi:hypothetical protein
MEHHKLDPAETRYRAAMDVKQAADLYAPGWTLRQIDAELGVPRTAVSHQIRGAGVTSRRQSRTERGLHLAGARGSQRNRHKRG